MTEVTAEQLIDHLNLARHPEGGWFAETYRHAAAEGGRGACTAIYYLLQAGEESAWHRVPDADELWHWYAGAPLTLDIAAPDGGSTENHTLGPAVLDGQRPQILVPTNAWQSARSQGDWTLVGCTVAPAFDFTGFEMAPDGWSPGPETP